jgi:hypothetical protein
MSSDLSQTYQQFESSFGRVLNEGNISQYSLLCAYSLAITHSLSIGGEVTARFKAISSTIIALQVTRPTQLTQPSSLRRLSLKAKIQKL